MNGWWSLLAYWAIWPTAFSILLGFAAFAVLLSPVECGSSRRSSTRRGLRN
jgi:hypothetical protein